LDVKLCIVLQIYQISEAHNGPVLWVEGYGNDCLKESDTVQPDRYYHRFGEACQAVFILILCRRSQ